MRPVRLPGACHHITDLDRDLQLKCRFNRWALRGYALSTLFGTTILGYPLTASADADADAKISRLLQLLVQKKIVSPRQAHELFRETEGASRPSRTLRTGAPAEAPPPVRAGEIRVTYVPQFIRKQIADQVRAQMVTESKDENWTVPGNFAEWTRRMRVYGDLRVRYERDSFSRGNYNQFTNFQAVNQGSPYNLNGLLSLEGGYPPFLNTTQDRDRARVRARFGVEALIDEGLTANIRVSTGADQGPVTPNQTQGQPGDFAKYAVYIDRANFAAEPIPGLSLHAGRFDNPFSTTDLIFYSELGFDGVEASYTHPVTHDASAYITGGVFPILNTAFDFSTNSVTKYNSSNAYLLAVQGGGQWKARPDVTAKLGVGFFDFNGVQGAVSKRCSEALGPGFVYYCSTDSTRFPFKQFGNTVYAIRNIIPAPEAPNPNYPPDPQYFGLASRFAVLEAHPRVEITTYEPIDLVLDGEYLKNLAFNRAAILAHGPPNGPPGPQNNLGSSKNPGLYDGPYQGGDTAYMVRAQLGALQIHRRWDWNVTAAYKYIETDATLDSINDSDFHLGGTNAKGYQLGASLGLARDTYLSLRYFAATVISGPPDSNQVFQIDLQSSF